MDRAILTWLKESSNMLLANSQQIRTADKIQIEERGFPGILLMENAGRMCAEFLFENYPGQKSFLVLAGPGNNGGDGLVIARHLFLAGKEVQVLLSHPPTRFTGDAAVNYRIISELPIPLLFWDEEDPDDIVSSFAESPIVIDALLGTGIHDSLRGPIADIVAFFRNHPAPRIAIDLPSGLSADTGEAINQPIPAHHTLTFQLPKICHYVTPASNYCGEISTFDIGLWPEVIESLGIRRRVLDNTESQLVLKNQRADSHKGTFGHVLAAGGSRHMAGSIAMTAFSALKSGAGLVTVVTPGSCRQTILNHVPEAMCLGAGDEDMFTLGVAAIEIFDQALKGKQAVCIGPGLSNETDTYEFLSAVLPMVQVPLVLDADALNLLAESPEMWAMIPEKTIITPHPGEMKRLMGLDTVNNRRMESAERLAQDRNVVVVLKGAGTIIASPDGNTYVNTSGNPGMATAGSGDVLTGVICSLLAQGYSPEVAATLGVYLHGQAGDRAVHTHGMRGLLAMDLARELGK